MVPFFRHKLTRRALLGLGLAFGGTALVLGGFGVVVLRHRPAKPGRAVLSDDEERFVAALTETYFPPGNAIGVAGGDVDVPGAVDAMIDRLRPREANLFRGLIAAFDAWPRVSLSSTARFSALPLDARVSILTSWEESALASRQQLASALRILVAMPYFEDARVRAGLKHSWGCQLPVVPS